MQKERIILHIDANNFYASVEMRLNEALRDKAVAVSGNPEKRHGIILAKSQQAKAKGVQTGEPIWQARRKCPELILVAPHFNEYVKFSKELFRIYTEYTDRVEPFSIDECWLDVTGSTKLFGSGEEIAETIRQRVKDELGITVSIGVSFTKIFAKLGSDLKKPDAVTVINRDNYKNVVWRLPVQNLMMVGSSTEKTFSKLNISTIGDLAIYNRSLLKQNIGINADKLIDYANGIEDDEVRFYYDKHIPESVGHSTTLPLDIKTLNEVEAIFSSLAEMVATRLRRLTLEANSVSIWIKYNNLESITRQTVINIPTNTGKELADYALRIFKDNYDFDKDLPIRALGLSTSKLTYESEREYQMSLFDIKDEKNEHLEKAVDKLREKYGYDIMKKASTLKYKYICNDLKNEEFLPFKK